LLVSWFADNIFFVSSGSPRSLKTPFQDDAPFLLRVHLARPSPARLKTR
jgi:hypothetical protein